MQFVYATYRSFGTELKLNFRSLCTKFQYTKAPPPNDPFREFEQCRWKCLYCKFYTSVRYTTCAMCHFGKVPSYWYCENCTLCHDEKPGAQLFRCSCNTWSTPLIIVGATPSPDRTNQFASLNIVQNQKEPTQIKTQKEEEKGQANDLILNQSNYPWLKVESYANEPLSWVCDSNQQPCIHFYPAIKEMKKELVVAHKSCSCLCGRGQRIVYDQEKQIICTNVPRDGCSSSYLKMGYSLDETSQEYWCQRKSSNLRNEFISWTQFWANEGFVDVSELRVNQEIWYNQKNDDNISDNKWSQFSEIAHYATRLLSEGLLDCVCIWNLQQEKEETWEVIRRNISRETLRKNEITNDLLMKNNDIDDDIHDHDDIHDDDILNDNDINNDEWGDVELDTNPMSIGAADLLSSASILQKYETLEYQKQFDRYSLCTRYLDQLATSFTEFNMKGKMFDYKTSIPGLAILHYSVPQLLGNILLEIGSFAVPRENSLFPFPPEIIWCFQNI